MSFSVGLGRLSGGGHCLRRSPASRARGSQAGSSHLADGKADVIVSVDEVGYIPFDAEAANLFFQLVFSRYERGSAIVTSNKPFTARGGFGDPVVAAAMIDRIVHHAEIPCLNGDSYRLRDMGLSDHRPKSSTPAVLG